MSAQLNLLLIDALLKAYGVPKLSDMLRKLPLIEREVEVIVEADEGKASETMCNILESFAKLSNGRIRLEKKSRSKGCPPPPTVRVYGLLGGRVRFHGLIDGILLEPLVETILYAGGGLTPPSIDREPSCKRRVEIWVVPGRPCLVTLRSFIPLAAACDMLEIDVVDAREAEKNECKTPAPFMPAIVIDGKLAKVGSVKKVEDALEMIA